jgi:hypothetical protein
MSDEIGLPEQRASEWSRNRGPGCQRLLAGIGAYRLASGIIALTCLLLVEKSRLHSLVARIDDVGLQAGVRFGVMALVVLPLLPAGPYGPFGGIRPRELWALVLFFSGLSFLGLRDDTISCDTARHS